jgi:hypothetical protein
MSAEYVERKVGNWPEYLAALAADDFDTAWQILVHLALTAQPADRTKVEDAAFSAVESASPALVRGALEALSLLLRLRHRVDRQRFETARRALDPVVATDQLVQDQILDVEMWWAEGNDREP